jgi:FtsH-binding integral membrane protein
MNLDMYLFFMYVLSVILILIFSAISTYRHYKIKEKRAFHTKSTKHLEKAVDDLILHTFKKTFDFLGLIFCMYVVLAMVVNFRLESTVSVLFAALMFMFYVPLNFVYAYEESKEHKHLHVARSILYIVFIVCFFCWSVLVAFS